MTEWEVLQYVGASCKDTSRFSRPAVVVRVSPASDKRPIHNVRAWDIYEHVLEVRELFTL